MRIVLIFQKQFIWLSKTNTNLSYKFYLPVKLSENGACQCLCCALAYYVTLLRHGAERKSIGENKHIFMQEKTIGTRKLWLVNYLKIKYGLIILLLSHNRQHISPQCFRLTSILCIRTGFMQNLTSGSKDSCFNHGLVTDDWKITPLGYWKWVVLVKNSKFSLLKIPFFTQQQYWYYKWTVI